MRNLILSAIFVLSSQVLSAQVAGAGSVRANVVDVVNSGEFRTNGNRVNYTLSTYAAGTAYALTTTSAALDFGTTDPVRVIDKAGTYLLYGRAQLRYNAATFAASQTATIKLRRTNNTAADVTAGTSTSTLRIITAITDNVGTVILPPVVYTTTATDDSITLFGIVSAAPSAGSVEVTEASIVAVRLY